MSRSRRLPPLKSLLAFEAAARCVNFTQAAAELAVTPSAISHQIQALEAWLGVDLFLRKAGRVELTPAGAAYRSEVAAALDLVAAATQRIAPQAEGNTLLVLSSPGFAAKCLQPLLPDFMTEHPGIRVRLATMDAPATLRSARFDVAVCYGALADPDMHVVGVMAENIRPLCSPSLVSALRLRSLADLARATLIHSANMVTWEAFLERAGLGGLRSSNEIWLDRSSMAIDAAVAGLGVVLESDLLAQAELRDGRLVAPFSDAPASISEAAYTVVVPNGYRTRRQSATFASWLSAAMHGAEPR